MVVVEELKAVIVGIVCHVAWGLEITQQSSEARPTLKVGERFWVQSLRDSRRRLTGEISGACLLGSVDDRSLSWKELGSNDQDKLTFLLCAEADFLPTQRNVNIWGKEGSSLCTQCGVLFCTLNHIITGCPKALRYRSRHDKVLTEIAK